MNQKNADSLSCNGETTKPKSLTPAILGVPKSHGLKLSHMTLEDKKEFMKKLEEWRKARRENLAAKILAKQKLVEKTKPMNFAPSKTKFGIVSSKDKESVFERLYNGNGKFKKPGVNESSNKVVEVRNIKKSVLGTTSKSLKVLAINSALNENSNASAYGSGAGKNLSSFVISSNDPKQGAATANSQNGSSNTFEQTPNPAFDVVSQVVECKFVEPKLVKSKSSEGKKLETRKTPNFKLPALKNSPLKMGVKITLDKSKIPLRRSLSMLFRQKNKTENTIRRSASAKNIHELQVRLTKSVNGSRPNSKDEATSKSVSFVTPKMKPLLTSTHLRSKLEDWLKLKGHPLEGYRHLRCFGTDNATNIQSTPCIQSDDCLENSRVATALLNTASNESNKENMTPPTATFQAADVVQVENWLKELRVLISEVKYPSDRCEEWLEAIRKKYPKCSQLPTYWECLAALNESKGDMKSAIDYYERAIIKGGEVDSVGNSLALLFDKMVLEQKKPTKSKIEKGIDPKNIFKSTIIKFALQQKTLRKLGPQIAPSVREQLYIATPVRRSSRIQTPFKSKEVASLETLSPDVKKNLTFKPNESLLEAD